MILIQIITLIMMTIMMIMIIMLIMMIMIMMIMIIIMIIIIIIIIIIITNHRFTTTSSIIRPISLLTLWISQGLTQARLDFKGWNSQAHRGFPGKFESSNVSRLNVSRRIGRKGVPRKDAYKTRETWALQTIHVTVKVKWG